MEAMKALTALGEGLSECGRTDLGHFCCSKGGQSRCIRLVKSCDSRAAHSAYPQRHKGSVAPLLRIRAQPHQVGACGAHHKLHTPAEPRCNNKGY